MIEESLIFEMSIELYTFCTGIYFLAFTEMLFNIVLTNLIPLFINSSSDCFVFNCEIVGPLILFGI
jgi:hypothetical protein